MSDEFVLDSTVPLLFSFKAARAAAINRIPGSLRHLRLSCSTHSFLIKSLFSILSPDKGISVWILWSLKIPLIFRKSLGLAFLGLLDACFKLFL